MKVLVSAYACEPDAGSEPGAGWQWARAAATRHAVWLLTRTNNAARIERALAESSNLTIKPVYLDLPPRMTAWKRGRRGIRTYYLLWQALARRRSLDLHRDFGFDLVHHLTFAVDWLPAGVSALAHEVPFVWGPVGGATTIPAGMWRWLGWKGVLEEASRALITRIGRSFAGDAMARRAAVVIGQNLDVAERFGAERTMVEPNVALEPFRFKEDGRTDSSRDNRACFVGRLAPLKGLRIVLSSLALDSAKPWTLDVFGDGPDRGACERIAIELGVSDRVNFHGTVPRDDVIDAYSRSRVLIFPSLHDAAGWAIAEAMMVGCRVITLEHGGPAVVAQGTGVTKLAPGLDVPWKIARTLQRLPNARPAPDRRWTAERLPDRIEEIYERAHSDRTRASKSAVVADATESKSAPRDVPMRTSTGDRDQA